MDSSCRHPVSSLFTCLEFICLSSGFHYGLDYHFERPSKTGTSRNLFVSFRREKRSEIMIPPQAEAALQVGNPASRGACGQVKGNSINRSFFFFLNWVTETIYLTMHSNAFNSSKRALCIVDYGVTIYAPKNLHVTTVFTEKMETMNKWVLLPHSLFMYRVTVPNASQYLNGESRANTSSVE